MDTDWKTRYLQAKDEIALLAYESMRWKEQYHIERERRRKLSRALLDALSGYAKSPHYKAPSDRDCDDLSAVAHNISDSTLLSPEINCKKISSDLDPIETLLSPTLSSFDFDDDSEVMSDDDEFFLSSEMRVEQEAIAGTKINVEDTIVSEHSFLPPFRTYFCKREVRTARAKTIGVCERSRHDEYQRSTLDAAEGEARLRGILYRMTYTKSDATDLWATKQNPGRFEKDIARSLFVSMQMRGTHIFEQLIVAGVQFRPEDIDVPDQELSAFWNPSVLSAYPSSHSAYDASIADFCFPKGVPVVACDPTEAKVLRGATITQWVLDAKSLIENVSENVSSGYIFRLTGAKGEILYGCCVAIMQDVLVKYEDQRTCYHSNATKLLAPVSYCLISKYPFYRLHFTILRMLIEIQYGKRETNYTDYKVEWTSGEHQQVEFAKASDITSHDVGQQRFFNHHLDTIAPNRKISNGVIIVNENKPSTLCAHKSEQCFTQTKNVDKLQVVAIRLPDADIQVGDFLESVNGIATDSISIHESLTRIQSKTRPLSLRFRRITDTESVEVSELLSYECLELLERMQTMKLEDPGNWINVRLPRNRLEFLCPELAPERWAAIIAIRLITPASMVQILGALLLEKQMVIMGENVACVSAVCAGLVLLLAPFRWQFTFIPLLPSHLKDFLHSPVPFLVGCHTISSTCEWPDLFFYNIDNGVLQAPHSEYNLSSIPDVIGEKLKQCLHDAKQSLDCSDLEMRPTWFELTDEEEANVASCLNQVSDLLSGLCSDFSLNYSQENGNGELYYEQFQEHLWQVVRTSKLQVFLEAFIQTQMFCCYCENMLKLKNRS